MVEPSKHFVVREERRVIGYPSRRPQGCGMQSPSGPKVYPKSTHRQAPERKVSSDVGRLKPSSFHLWEEQHTVLTVCCALVPRRLGLGRSSTPRIAVILVIFLDLSALS